MKLKRYKYGAILVALSIMLVGCTDVTETEEYKVLQSKHEELEDKYKKLESKLDITEKQLELKNETIQDKNEQIKKLNNPNGDSISKNTEVNTAKNETNTTKTEDKSTTNQYIEKYGVDISNRKPFNEVTIQNLDIITNNGKDKLTAWEQECYFNNWNTVMLDQNNIWHFDEHCNKVTGNLDLIGLNYVNISVSDKCYKCGW